MFVLSVDFELKISSKLFGFASKSCVGANDSNGLFPFILQRAPEKSFIRDIKSSDNFSIFENLVFKLISSGS